MEEKIESARTWQLLESDDDILLLDRGETFTVAKLKELLWLDFKRLLETRNEYSGNIYNFLGALKAGQTIFSRSELIWKSKIIDCQFLKIGSKGWQKGKIRIQCIPESKLDSNSRPQRWYIKVKVDIEFSPDEPPQPESPLDDLRELPEYKQQL